MARKLATVSIYGDDTLDAKFAPELKLRIKKARKGDLAARDKAADSLNTIASGLVDAAATAAATRLLGAAATSKDKVTKETATKEIKKMSGIFGAALNEELKTGYELVDKQKEKTNSEK